MTELLEPLIRCILPEYEDSHYQWLISQYLERSGFHATLATFSLELKAKGFKLEDSEKLDEVRSASDACEDAAASSITRAGSP